MGCFFYEYYFNNKNIRPLFGKIGKETAENFTTFIEEKVKIAAATRNDWI